MGDLRSWFGARQALFGSVLAVVSFGISGCFDGVSPNRIGSTCAGDSACDEGLCISETCLDPDADEDGDGLTNAIERALKTNALEADSDGDGVDDLAEIVNASTPVDTDGDGLLDAIESATADQDNDCISDQLDAQNAVALVDPAELAAKVCVREGVCGAGGATATCNEVEGVRVHSCDYSGVAGYAETDVVCDDLDNDCNGVTDDAFMDGTVTWDGEGGQASKGAACGLGACAGGSVICSLDGLGLACSGLAEATVESCDAVDNDCDGETDEGQDASGCVTYWLDVDGDGAGRDGDSQCLCAAVDNYRGLIPGDCADDNVTKGPNAEPICGQDNDCSGGLLDAGEACDDGNDVFGDGCLSCAATETSVWSSAASWPSVAGAAVLDGGAWAILFDMGWNSQTQSAGGFGGRFYDVNGTLARSASWVSDPTQGVGYSQVRLSSLGDSYLLTWVATVGDSQRSQLFARRYSKAGVAVGPVGQVSLAGLDWFARVGALELGGGETLIYWSGQDFQAGYDTAAWARIDAGAGTDPIVIPLSDTGADLQGLEIVALKGGGFLISWTQSMADKGYVGQTWFKRFNADGTVATQAWAPIVAGDYSHEAPRLLGRDSGGFVLTYLESDLDYNTTLWLQHYDDFGVSESAAVEIIPSSESPSWNYQLAAIDGGLTMIIAQGGYDQQEEGHPATARVVDLQSPDGGAVMAIQTPELLGSIPTAPILASAPGQFFLMAWTASLMEQPHVWVQRFTSTAKLYTQGEASGQALARLQAQ